MSCATSSELQSVVARVRNQLWRERILLRSSRALAWSGAILLATGLVQKFHAPVNWVYTATAAALPFLAALVVSGLRDRPSLTAAAAAADRRLGSRELLCSAFEQSRLASARRAGSAPVVLERAERIARAVRPRDYQRRRLSPSVPVSLGLAFAGVMLHLTSGRAGPPPLGEMQSSPKSTAAAPARAPFAELEGVLADIRVQRRTSPSTPLAGDPRAETASIASRSLQTNIPGQTAVHSRHPGAGARGTPAGFSPGEPGGDEAGAMADRKLRQGQSSDTGLAVHRIDIPRRDGDRGSTSARPAVVTPVASAATSHSAVPAAEGAPELRRSLFGPALRKYVHDYLASLRESR